MCQLNPVIDVQDTLMVILLICMTCRTETNALNYQIFVESE